MALRKLSAVTQRLSCNVPVIQQRFLSVGNPLMKRYSKHFMDPNPDPEFYRNNPPLPTDRVAFRPVKAAPTWQTYSTFYDETLYKFERMIIKKGKSSSARRMTRTMLEYIKSDQVRKYHRASEEEKETIELNPLVIFHKAIENAKPLLGLTRISKGSSAYQVPFLLSPKKQFFLAFKGFQNHVWVRHQNTDAAIRLGKEMLNAYNNTGAAVKSKQSIHKQAFANRAYANLLASPLARRAQGKKKRRFK